MTEHVGWYIEPNHPDAKAVALQENLRRGWAPVPGQSDHDMGTFLRATHPTGPLYVPTLPGPPARRTAGGGNWVPVPVLVSVAAFVGFLTALTVVVMAK